MLSSNLFEILSIGWAFYFLTIFWMREKTVYLSNSQTEVLKDLYFESKLVVTLKFLKFYF